MLKRSKWKSKYFLYEEASNFHNKIRDILLSETFAGIDAYQEVPLKDLVDCENNLRVDWYLEPFNICIELHGKQHYQRTNFAYKEKVASELDWIASSYRDNLKKSLLEENGYLYIEIPYTVEDRINEKYLEQLLKDKINERES